MSNPPANSRVLPKPKTPIGLLLALIFGGILLLTGIFFALSSLQTGFSDARMRGVITQKEFEPAPETKITLGETGLRARTVEGNFYLTVSVPMEEGEPRIFNVWVPKEIYDEVEVGDPFDVGPYIQKD